MFEKRVRTPVLQVREELWLNLFSRLLIRVEELLIGWFCFWSVIGGRSLNFR